MTADALALPRGAYDLLPDAARRRTRLTDGLLAVLDRWGYDRVMTPAVEYFAVFGRWLTERDRQRCVRFIEAGTGELVTLRSDITPQIARLSALHMADRLAAGEALRLAYAADVVRLGEDTRGQVEHHQVGAELLGDDSPEADAELICVVAEALRAAGLGDATIELADVSIARAVFSALPDECDAAALHGLLARKDVDGVARMVETLPVRELARRGLRLLCESFGGPEILRSVPDDLRTAWPWLAQAIDRLAQVIRWCERDDPSLVDRLVIDLGEVRGHDYYTGLRLRVWAPGVATPLVVGGRYAGGAGFAVELAGLEVALEHAGAIQASAGDGVVVAAATADVRAQASAAAAEIRRAGGRAWVQVGLAPDAAQAASAAASRLIYIDAAGAATHWQPTASGWRIADAGR